MRTYPVEVYIYELSQESRSWCRDQFMQILADEEVVLHSSVVVHGVEYSFGRSGIEEQKPKLRPQYLSEDDFEGAASWTNRVGRTKLTKSEVGDLVSIWRKSDMWFSFKYSAAEHNCHHFTEALVKSLCGDGVALPLEVHEFNRILMFYRKSWISKFCRDEDLQ